ncbi:SAVMC3_10250 family protein [Streptomyces sp. NPDC015414]|uniref:SAVMC3_10250 family protein n=1 Tax=Streptomyces sp. NPDC015414 TaxID=3364957 RepID=UPI0036FB09E8
MQDLIYVSDAKLRQFMPETQRRSWTGRRVTGIKLGASAASFSGNVEVALDQAGGEQNNADQLAAVVKDIGGRAPWYWERARAGAWVYFEAPLFAFLPMLGRIGTVLFTDTPPGRVEGHDPAHGTRLLLHGSRKHLLADVPPTNLRAPGVNRSRLHMAIDTLRSVAPPTADQIDAPAPPMRETGFADPSAFGDLFHAVSPLSDAAAWMRGYARVSLVTQAFDRETEQASPLVVATPLFVAYAPDLPD